MRVIRQTDYVFTLTLTLNELYELNRLSKHGIGTIEKHLEAVLDTALLGPEQTDPESEDSLDVER